MNKNNYICRCGHIRGWHDKCRGMCIVLLNIRGDQPLYHECNEYKKGNLEYLEDKYNELCNRA